MVFIYNYAYTDIHMIIYNYTRLSLYVYIKVKQYIYIYINVYEVKTSHGDCRKRISFAIKNNLKKDQQD